MTRMVACCGLICTDCPAYLATQSDDDSERVRIAAAWSARFGIEFTPEDINCDGCRVQGGRLSGYCRNLCQIRPCAGAKGLENCAGCDEYACDKLEAFLAEAPEARLILEAIRAGQP
jgi:hypothetical protein